MSTRREILMNWSTAPTTRQWLSFIVFAGIFCVADVMAATQSVAPDDQSHYEFAIKKGAGIPVCDAYLRRLNATEFEAPPFCGLSESSKIPGFSFLHRVPLTPAETERLYPRIVSFLGTQMSTPPHPLDTYNMAWARSGGGGPAIFAWRYDPPIDIDNDGTSRAVVVWSGPPFENSNRPCGSVPEDPRLTQPLRWARLAFVVTPDGRGLDDARTLATFGRPPTGAPKTIQFQSIWLSLDIFRYGDEMYFDTFLDEPGQDDLAVFHSP